MDVRGRPLSLTITTALAVAVLATGACSRMTFVRQDFKRQDFERTTPVVNVSGNANNKAAVAASKPLELARARLMVGDYEAAEKEALKALKLDPKSVDAETVLAVTAARRGDSAAAGAHYQRAAELAPDNGAVQNNYGVWLCREGRTVESLAWFDRALKDPRYTTPAVALANSGSCAARAGQDDRARRTCAGPSNWTRTTPRRWARLRSLSSVKEMHSKRAHSPSAVSRLHQQTPGRCSLRHKSKRNSATGLPPQDTFSE